jgi:large subunit ribosomal protein L22
MPEITHHTRSIRIAPRKLRLVVDKIRHLPAEEALTILPLITKRGSLPIAKALKAAVEAAKDAHMDPSTLVIQRAWADEGKALKRVIRFSRGRSGMIMKKYSHIGIVLKGEEKVRTKKAKLAKTEETSDVPKETEPVAENQE